MQPSTGLPSTSNLDRNILKHFDKLCLLKDSLHHPPHKKQKAATPQETDRLSLVHQEIVRRSQILGIYLGKRLYAKYSQVVVSNLQGEDGYAILDLVPGNTSSWTPQKKETLISWFHLEIKSHLDEVEAIKPTFSQVNMRKVKDSLIDGSSPLTSSFLRQLNGQEESLFPLHTFTSYQLLETSAGIPVPMTTVEVRGIQQADRSRFMPDAPVLIKSKITVKKKVSSVKKSFVECVPHLVSEFTFEHCLNTVLTNNCFDLCH
jgi:hypothetical protein